MVRFPLWWGAHLIYGAWQCGFGEGEPRMNTN